MATQAIDKLAVVITASNQTAAGLKAAERDLSTFARGLQKLPVFAKGQGAAALFNVPRVPPPPAAAVAAWRGLAAHARSFAAAAASAPLRAGAAALARTADAARDAGAGLARMAALGAATGGTIVALELGLSGLAGAFGQLKQSVQLAAELEQNTLAFEVMLKSGDRAREMLAEVRKFAASTPFNLGELTGAARQLVAYGVAADQVVPTIKMLGDVTAAFPTHLKIQDLTYLYGTLFAQQRAYAIDVRQFGNHGIPIYEELAKVVGKSTAEVRTLIEEGQISSREVTQAFVNMTSAGGRFFEMTKRQGQTFAGTWEQMTDAFQLAKLALGKVLVRELGLQDAARDLQAFAQRLEAGTDAAGPAVRLFGELARAGAQVGYEFAKAAAAVGDMNLRAYGEAFPGFGDAAETVRRVIRQAASFQLDEADAVRFGFALGKSLASAASDWGGHLADFGEGLAKVIDLVVKGAKEAKDLIAWTARQMNAINDAAADGRKFLVKSIPVLSIADALAGGPAPAAAPPGPPAGRRDVDPLQPPHLTRPPEPGITPSRALAEWRGLSAALAAAERAAAQSPLGPAPRDLAALRAAHAGFVGGFVGDPAGVARHLDAGRVPPVRGGWGDPGLPGADKPLFDLTAATAFFGRFRQPAGGVLAALEERERAELAAAAGRAAARAAAQQERVAAAAAATADSLAYLRVHLAGLGGPTLSPLADLARLAGAAHLAGGRELQGTAALGGLFGPLDAHRGPAGAVRPPNVFPALEELARDLNREFGDPMAELKKYKDKLDRTRALGLFQSDAVFNRAWVDKVDEAAGRLGIGRDPHRTADAALVGTAEDARVVNAFRASGAEGRMTVERLLERIAAAVERENRRAEARARGPEVAPPPRPVKVKILGD